MDTSAYGIVFRAQAQGPTDRTNARYTFIVYANGSFALTMARADGTVAVVAPRTPSPVIKRGDDTNHLTILCWGDRISLAINGYVVGEYEVTLSGAGAIGLYVSSPENTPSPPGMEAGFKDLRVSTVAAP